MADEIEPASAQTPLFQALAELRHELADVAGDGLRSADRLGERSPHLDQVGWSDRDDRFGDFPEGLGQSTGDRGSETKG